MSKEEMELVRWYGKEGGEGYPGIEKVHPAVLKFLEVIDL